MGRERFEVVSLSIDDIKKAAGDAIFEAGRALFLRSRVHEFSPKDRGVRGVVRSGHWYEAWIGPGQDILVGHCDCSTANERPVCEHAVALGLTWIDSQEIADDSESRAQRAPAGTAMGFAALAELPRDAILAHIKQWAAEIPDLRHKIQLIATRRPESQAQLQALTQMVLRTIHTRGDLDHTALVSFLQRTASVIDAIEEAASSLPTPEILDLIECALAAIEAAMQQVDDSYGGLSDGLERLQALHVRACERGAVDPVHLAERLFAWALRSDAGVFRDATKTHARALGNQGLDAYRQLAETEWAKVRTRGPGGERKRNTDLRYRIQPIMLLLAKLTGRVEEEIAVLSRDLSNSHCYSSIVRVALDADRPDMAVEWTQKGLAAFGDKCDLGLLERGSEAFRLVGRVDDALAMAWRAFEIRHDLDGYKHLLSCAEVSGSREVTRQRALRLFRGQIRSVKSNPAFLLARENTPQSELVRILLWEKDIGAAVSQATTHGCSGSLWSQIAEAWEPDHPEEAITFHMRVIAGHLDRRNDDAYRAATSRLERVRRITERIGKPQLFDKLVEDLREEHKPKRNFRKMLDEKGW